MRQHNYKTQIDWTGNNGGGTKDYRSYQRSFTVVSDGKGAIQGSSDPAFRGDPSRYNPEELLVASISSCHMLWYLHLCAINQVVVQEYCDEASGELEELKDGSGSFTRVQLRPKVTISPSSSQDVATTLHHEAHAMCFIARSVNFPVDILPTITRRQSDVVGPVDRL